MNRILIVLLLACRGPGMAANQPSATLDLRKFGYQLNSPTSGLVLVDYTGIGFLSEDSLLISVNQRTFGPVEFSLADAPESVLIVFDVKHRSVVRVGKMTVEKARDSIQPVMGGRFAALNEKGVRFCNAALQCGPAVETAGPIFVSPQGKRVALGGNALTAQIVFDTESWKQVAKFECCDTAEHPRVIPGDGAMLVIRNRQITIQRSGVEGVLLDIDAKGTFSQYRFLNLGSLAALDDNASEAVVIGVDGKQIRRYKVEKAWRTGFLPTSSGMRFGIYEHGYTALNSVLNVLDIDGGRPQNFQRVRIIDILSGNEVFQIEWDPRPHLVTPALSPSGHRLARVRNGIVEVFQVQ